MPVQNPGHASAGGRAPSSSGGQNRLGWGCSALLAVLAITALLSACRDVTGPATATPSAAITRLASAPTATWTPSATLTPAATRTPTEKPTQTATATRTSVRTATRTRVAEPANTPTPTLTRTSTATPRPARVLQTAEVFEVIDGDTIGVRIDGQAFRVRYIGIDTPEIVHPGIPVEPFGPEAAQANRRMVLGQRVLLERDVSDTDTYGRLLRYVWLGDTLISAELVRLGLAQSNHYEPDVLYQNTLDALESQARAAGLGIWSITPTPPPQRSQPSGVHIAGVNKSGRPETVTLSNAGLAPVDISGWTLISVRGNQRFSIPVGAVLEAGASVTIYSGPGADAAGPLFWTTDNMWNNSEFDPAELYDASGVLVDRWEG
ncbi:MAG: thermonuclease family protein [Anaerolineae bacterium]